jgi:glycosyltransferase involved in cell wall biosynthesis
MQYESSTAAIFYRRRPSMRVQIVDPSAFTPPYDRSLAAALARAGAEVELVTSRFVYGPVPPADGYAVNELFYRRSARLRGRARFAVKLAEHVPDMLRLRRAGADVVHFQWLTVQPVDVALLPRRPRVLTAHDVIPREPRPGQLRATRRLARKMDAVVVHSRHGAARLRDELGVEPGRIHVIPHPAFDYLTKLPREEPLPAELDGTEGPVVLFFGLLRPYKGIDVLLDAGIDASVWIVGHQRMPLPPTGPRVHVVPRFVTDAELPAYFRRADVVVLPYREIDQSGVLATALAFGKPVVASAVGGFQELADDYGAIRTVRPGDPAALRTAVSELLADRREREQLAAAAARAAAGPLSWDEAARRTLAVYEGVL